jgi:hypothetical protein
MKITTRSLVNCFAISSIAIMSATFGSVISAQAATIGDLYSTGVDNSGVVLGEGVSDSHYSLLSVPSGTNDVVARASTVPSVWLGSNTTSAWIGPNTDGAFNAPEGDYIYRTTFDLSNFIASTAEIKGKWTADNTATDIFLNGKSLGLAGNTFNAFSSDFTILDGTNGANFVEGVNELKFFVNNAVGPGSNPTGLRAELSGTATTKPVPEPADFIGTAIAFGSVVMLKRNFSKKAK